ncbi:MAG: SIS domain-containing protein [Bacteroidota bacterium]
MNIPKNIRSIAIRTLNNEARAVENLINLIDDDFESCVKAILNSKGRVVVTGVGKSAIIANKIVATLNSTGTPALFLHAADAIHGDLGMVQPTDIVICISKSGNTPEIKVLTPLLKRRGQQLVALVSNPDSYLAKQADFVLNASIAEEACPNNLAPTTSTTVHMAMGDALAVCLLELRNFTSADFAQFHPGGSLGKQLYLKVADIYPSHARPVVRPDLPIKEVILIISSARLGAAAVTDEAGHLMGIITDGDLRRMLEKHSDLSGLTAADVMTRGPKTIDQSEFATRALEIMQNGNISQLVVTDENRVAGFVHLHDLLKEGIA